MRETCEYVTVPPIVEDPAAFVRRWEEIFDGQLDTVVRAICRDCVEKGVQVIRLSGPTCAGKTTTAHKLTEALEASGCRVYPISLDDFFYGRDDLNERAAQADDGPPDYDSVNALDLATLKASLGDLLNHGKAELPIYDFVEGDRVGFRTLDVRGGTDGRRPVFLLEGIQAVYPEVVAQLNGVPDVSIFSNVTQGLRVGDTLFRPNDIRLMRRLVRDEAKRNATPAFTLYLWESVRKNEEACILPQAQACDYRVNSLMGFDLHMLAPHLRRIFSEHPVEASDPYAGVARDLLERLEGIEGISSDLLAPDSLYHEFILT